MIAGGAGVFVDEVAGQRTVDQHGELTGGGSNRFGVANAGGEAAVKGAKRGRSTAEAHGAAAQNSRRSIGGWRGPGTEQASAGDFVMGSQREPGGKVLLGFPAAHIGADLGYELKRGVRADRVDLAQVGTAGESMQWSADLKAGLAVFRLPRAPRSRERGLGLRLLFGECRQQGFDGGIAFLNLLEQELIGFEVLLKREQVLGAIVAGERSGDLCT